MNNEETNLVSIIIPAYNAEKFISATIESALQQSIDYKEIIIVDDGSTDSTLSIVKSFGDKVKCIQQENQGVSAARNKAVNAAVGKWIAFLDADDIWYPEKLEKQLTFMGDAKWSYTDSQYVGDHINSTIYRSDLTSMHEGLVYAELIVTNFLTTSTILMSKDLYLEHGGMDESLVALEDWNLWVKLSRDNKISYIKESLAEYRVYPGSTSRKVRQVLPIHEQVIEGIYSEISEDSELQLLKPKALVSSYGACAYIAEDSADYIFALNCMIKAVLLSPNSFRHWKSIVRIIIHILLFPIIRFRDR